MTLFTNRAVVERQAQMRRDACPFDFETGEFKPKAVEVFRARVSSVIEPTVEEGRRSLHEQQFDAEDRLDELTDRLIFQHN